MVPLDDIQVDVRQNYVDTPVANINKRMKTLYNKYLDLVNLKWQHCNGSKWTWETEDEKRE